MRVNEIFYSLQGEGCFTGTPAVFVRFSGCNLTCPFCDTDHLPFKEMTEEDIVDEVNGYSARHIVLTGGEPTLQITDKLLNLLHNNGWFVQIETNGTVPLHDACEIDWVTCSPKEGGELRIKRIDELKILYHGDGVKDMNTYSSIVAKEYRLQPLDTHDETKNMQILSQTITYIMNNPKWKLSLQTHKMIGVR